MASILDGLGLEGSVLDGLESGPLLAGLDKPKVSICTIKALIKEALAELAESPLDVEDFNLVVDAFMSRGLLCDECNKGLGAMRDSPKLLRKAAKYLEKVSD